MDARDFVRTAHALSVPCQLDVPFEDKMSDRGVLKKPNKQKTPQYFTPAPERIQFWLLNILDILYSWQHLLYVKQMSSLSLVCLEMTLLSMSFKKKKKKPGWGAETTEPLTGPRTMSQPPDQTLPPPPVSSTKTANKVGRLLGGGFIAPILSAVLYEPNPSDFTHETYMSCIFTFLENISVWV